MLRSTTAAAAVFLMGGAAQAAVFDFEDFANGEIVNSVSAGGVTAAITVNSNGRFDLAQVFDTEANNAPDPDLWGPFFGSGPANPGNILIISEQGPGSVPDDEAKGGTITFTFDTLVNFTGFDAFDDGIFDVTSDQDNLASFGEEILLNDNESGALTVDGFNSVSVLNFNFASSGKGASGGIDNLTFEIAGGPAPIPVPAALPMMLAGLGGLGYMARRRRAAA